MLLFYVLMVGHPLLGRRELEFAVWDAHAESVLFGSDPMFVFDPDDDTNSPLPAQHHPMLANWDIYPDFLQRLFVQAFTIGLSDPINGRVRESVWRSTLARLRDVRRALPCLRQGELLAGLRRRVRCWSCDGRLEDPVRLVIDGRALVLNADTLVHRHHLVLDYDFGTVVARVVRHPDRSDRWGLLNESTEPWMVVLPNADRIVAAPGQTVGLLPGTRIALGLPSPPSWAEPTRS